MVRHCLIACVVIIVISATVSAQAPTPLDVISVEAVGAIGIRNLNDLVKKGDRFLEEANLGEEYRISRLTDFLINFLGVSGVEDRNGAFAAGAVMLPMPKGAGLFSDFDLFVAIPFRDQSAVERKLGLVEHDLDREKIRTSKNVPFAAKCMVRGKHIFFANFQSTLERIQKTKVLSKEMAPSVRASLTEADIFLHARLLPSLYKNWPTQVKDWQSDAEKWAAPEEKVLIGKLAQALNDTPQLSIGLRIEKGLRSDFLLRFDQSEAATTILRKLRDTLPSDLKGLPEGRVVAAQASVGNRQVNMPLGRLVLSRFINDGLASRKVLKLSDQPAFLAAFDEIWRYVDHARWALYRNANESRDGLFSLVAIVDTPNPEQMMVGMRAMARMADGNVSDINRQTRQDQVDTAKLIQDLGSDEYSVRQSATNKLRLLGDAAIPHLEKAIDAKMDLEVFMRARRLREEINAVAVIRRKELLETQEKPLLAPRFKFISKAETRLGKSVEIVKMELGIQDQDMAKKLPQLLGPDWDLIRLVPHHGKIVALFGSDVALLDRTLANLAEKKDGLIASPPFQTFRDHAPPKRLFEIHAGLGSILDLVENNRDTGTPGEILSSLSAVVEADSIHVRFWLPTKEFTRIQRSMGVR